MTITLDPADYWRLRALAADVQRLQLEARATIQIAQAKQRAALAECAARYQVDLDPAATMELDDDTYTLTVHPARVAEEALT
jgi:hypothetical protein